MTKMQNHRGNKVISILFAGTMMGVLLLPAHAQTNSFDNTVGEQIQSLEIGSIVPNAREVTITIVLAEGVINSILGVRLHIASFTIGAPSIVETMTVSDNRVAETNILTKSINLTHTDISRDVGITILVGANLLDTNGNIVEGQTARASQAVALLCGYDTVPDIDYGNLTRGETATRTFTPSITDTNLFAQPSEVAFTISPFKIGNTTVVLPEHTSVNSIVGSNVTINSVNENTVFEFTTTLNFVDTSAYISSVGNTIRQTITITPTCN